jgi:hypothetical protein
MAPTSTHLLRDHDNEGSQGGAADSGDSEKFDTALEVVGSTNDLCLNLKLGVDVV